MGDLSAEPSMEEILSSIKRIIAEEGDQPNPRARRQPRNGPASSSPQPPTGDEPEDDASEVLELSDPMPPPRLEPRLEPRVEPPRSETVAPEPRPRPAAPPPEPASPPPAIVSAEAAAASRGALDQLTRLIVKPEPGSDGTLEGLVRDMLRPMLRDWLDARLPAMVETMVAKEIKRITEQGG